MTFSKIIQSNYEIHEWRHATAILRSDFPQARVARVGRNACGSGELLARRRWRNPSGCPPYNVIAKHSGAVSRYGVFDLHTRSGSEDSTQTTLAYKVVKWGQTRFFFDNNSVL